jgi:DNA-binding MarR family transcriptional regulator
MESTTEQRDLETRELDAVAAAARVFVGVVLASTADAESVVTLRQLRALVVLQRNGEMNLAGLAERLDVHPSNATRLCDQLVRARLLRRTQADHDRRHVVLRLTPAGERLVAGVLGHRRRALAEILDRMSPPDRTMLARTLAAFADAAGDLEDDPLWTS